MWLLAFSSRVITEQGGKWSGIFLFGPFQPWLGMCMGDQDSIGGFRGAGVGCGHVGQVSPLTFHYSSSPMHGTCSVVEVPL